VTRNPEQAGFIQIPKVGQTVAETLRVIDDTTLFTNVEYATLFDLAREAATSVGGTIKSEDRAAGSVQAKFRYGINPTGIRVGIQLRRSGDGETEVVVTGRIGDSFDTTGAGKKRGREVLNALAQRIETGSTTGPAAADQTGIQAPFVGTTGFPHRGKSKTVAMLLAFFVGGLGIHRFYLGTWGWGLVYLSASVVGLGAGIPLGIVPSLYDGVRFLLMKPENFDANYNYRTVSPFTF
jgi:TM2 domain-containing membrane protein YozV